MKPYIPFALLGAALMGYFGSQLGIRSGAGSGTVAAFTIGIFLIINAAIVPLKARLRQLEQQLANRDSGAATPSLTRNNDTH